MANYVAYVVKWLPPRGTDEKKQRNVKIKNATINEEKESRNSKRRSSIMSEFRNDEDGGSKGEPSREFSNCCQPH